MLCMKRPVFLEKMMQYLDKILKLVKKGRIKTKYSHYNLVYRRLKQFIFSVDCSGLLEFWLSKEHPYALAEIYDYVYQQRPVAKDEIKRLYSFDFYDFFCAVKERPCCCWQEVNIAETLQRGDIIAFINPKRAGRFGHVAIVDEEIKRNESKIVIKVIDSSAVEHMSDYRQSNKKGIGHGIIELYLQKNAVVSISFHPGQVKPRLVRIGRLR